MNPDLAARLDAQQALPGKINADFAAALSGEAALRTLKFMEGVKAYQHHPARRDVPEAPVIMRMGTTRIRDYNAAEPSAPIVLVIPSLINRFDILDLDLAPSFLRSMAMAGLRPLVVDWDAPGEEEHDFDLTDYVTQRLIPVMDAVAPQKPLHILGYCMGGLLALALAALRPANTKTLTLMATPWNFHAPDPAISASFGMMIDQLEPNLDAFGYLPVDIIQSLFAAFQPLQAMQKFTDFAAMDKGSMEARQFVLLEDWLNDGVPLTANVARTCFRDWYGMNATAALKWRVHGTVIDPRTINVPSYVVVPGRDRIVPPESALPLAHLLPHATLHEPMTGHIGMIASRSAPHQVWIPMLRWLGEHS